MNGLRYTFKVVLLITIIVRFTLLFTRNHFKLLTWNNFNMDKNVFNVLNIFVPFPCWYILFSSRNLSSIIKVFVEFLIYWLIQTILRVPEKLVESQIFIKIFKSERFGRLFQINKMILYHPQREHVNLEEKKI